MCATISSVVFCLVSTVAHSCFLTIFYLLFFVQFVVFRLSYWYVLFLCIVHFVNFPVAFFCTSIGILSSHIISTFLVSSFPLFSSQFGSRSSPISCMSFLSVFRLSSVMRARARLLQGAFLSVFSCCFSSFLVQLLRLLFQSNMFCLYYLKRKMTKVVKLCLKMCFVLLKRIYYKEEWLTYCFKYLQGKFYYMSMIELGCPENCVTLPLYSHILNCGDNTIQCFR